MRCLPTPGPHQVNSSLGSAAAESSRGSSGEKLPRVEAHHAFLCVSGVKLFPLAAESSPGEDIPPGAVSFTEGSGLAWK